MFSYVDVIYLTVLLQNAFYTKQVLTFKAKTKMKTSKHKQVGDREVKQKLVILKFWCIPRQSAKVAANAAINWLSNGDDKSFFSTL